MAHEHQVISRFQEGVQMSQLRFVSLCIVRILTDPSANTSKGTSECYKMNTTAFGSRNIATSPFTFTLNSHPDVNRIPQHDSQQDGFNKSNGYDRVAQDLRTALRDDDVEMEDASDWPASWENSDDEQESRVQEDGTVKQNPLSENHSGPLTIAGEEEPRLLYIALDTNIFISHLKTVQAIHHQLSQQKQMLDGSRGRTIKLLVPNIVIHGK
jgi:hypothetical protein